jgi:hypothetical protein
MWTQHHQVYPAYIDTVAIRVDIGSERVSIRISILNRHPDIDWDAKFEVCDLGESKYPSSFPCS